MSECKIVFKYTGGNPPRKLIECIGMLGAKGYRRFTIYVVSSKSKPYYLEDLKSLIEQNITYTLKIYYAGSTDEDLKELTRRLPAEDTVYLIDHSMSELK